LEISKIDQARQQKHSQDYIAYDTPPTIVYKI